MRGLPSHPLGPRGGRATSWLCRVKPPALHPREDRGYHEYLLSTNQWGLALILTDRLGAHWGLQGGLGCLGSGSQAHPAPSRSFQPQSLLWRGFTLAGTNYKIRQAGLQSTLRKRPAGGRQGHLHASRTLGPALRLLGLLCACSGYSAPVLYFCFQLCSSMELVSYLC